MPAHRRPFLHLWLLAYPCECVLVRERKKERDQRELLFEKDLDHLLSDAGSQPAHLHVCVPVCVRDQDGEVDESIGNIASRDKLVNV